MKHKETKDTAAREQLWDLIQVIKFAVARAAVTGRPPTYLGTHGEVHMR
ncbi:hypothetical protein ACVNIS_22600 [Sphaerotilaceae bacterium SBD11-9]